MKREYSLKGKTCFDNVFTSGKRYTFKGYRCVVLKVSETGCSICTKYKAVPPVKIGLIVTKRAGKAFARNKAKRRVRAILDEFLPCMDSGFCMAIRIDDRINNDFDYHAAKGTIAVLLQKAGVLKNDSSCSQ